MPEKMRGSLPRHWFGKPQSSTRCPPQVQTEQRKQCQPRLESGLSFVRILVMCCRGLKQLSLQQPCTRPQRVVVRTETAVQKATVQVAVSEGQ